MLSKWCSNVLVNVNVVACYGALTLKGMEDTHLIDCHVLSFCQVKICHTSKVQYLEPILSNFYSHHFSGDYVWNFISVGYVAVMMFRK